MQHPVLNLLRAALVPELRTDVAAGAAGNVHGVLVLIAALRAGPYQLAVLLLYGYFACPSHHNTVTRLKWLTALTVDPEAKRRMLGLARKVETEVDESWYEDFYHHLRMEMDEYRRLKRSLRVLKSYTDYEEDLYEEAV